MRRPSPALLLAALSLSGCAPEGPSAFVTFNVVPDSNCKYSPEGTDLFYPMGLFDVSPGEGGNDACANPYVVHLLVNSFLRSNSDPMLGRAEPNILQLHSAEVKLMDIQRRTIKFSGDLPNPFLVTTNNSLSAATGSEPATGIAVVEVIPSDYAVQLDDGGERFVGAQILAEIQIFGTTTGDVDIDFKPWVYAIELCDGCLTVCQQRDIRDNMLDPADFIGDDCNDNSGTDGRVCIDPGC
jgi:hypothetical protein